MTRIILLEPPDCVHGDERGASGVDDFENIPPMLVKVLMWPLLLLLFEEGYPNF